MERAWERWDDPGVAEEIEGYWANSPHEANHRQSLTDLCALYLRPSDGAVLEVGCGTGRIYERLVPRLLPPHAYTGVDTSEAMLSIARRRHPEGRFLRGDGFALGFGPRAFDVVLCFEVLGHLPEIDDILRELLHAARRTAIFTVWPAVDGVVEQSEQVRGSRFLQRRYSHAYLYQKVREAMPGRAVEMEVAVLHEECWAYVLHPRGIAGDLAFTRLFPVVGYGQRMRASLPARTAQA